MDLALAEVDRLSGTRPSGIRLVDLCAGSGAIALAVKQERPHVSVRSLELSEHAVAWAAANRGGSASTSTSCEETPRNASSPNGKDGRHRHGQPAHIPAGSVPLDPEVRDHDPELALYGGSEDGLATPVAVARTAAGLLRSGGLLLMEHADSQGHSCLRRCAARVSGRASRTTRISLVVRA